MSLDLSQDHSQPYLELIESALEGALKAAHEPSLLHEAARYAVFPGGKRVRPLFAALLCQDLQGPAKCLASTASALELLHCASLIHDDLPALDNDDERRGRPSCHKAFPEATAILAGDFLVPVAFQLIAASDFSPLIRTQLSQSLARAYADLCLGQQFDLQGRSSGLSFEDIHLLKTGALFRTAAEFVAFACEVPPLELDRFSKLGESIGLTFQLVDDFLDRYGSLASRGRSIRSDEKNARDTYFSETGREQGELLINKRIAITEDLLVRIEQRFLPEGQRCAETRRLLNKTFHYAR